MPPVRKSGKLSEKIQSPSGLRTDQEMVLDCGLNPEGALKGLSSPGDASRPGVGRWAGEVRSESRGSRSQLSCKSSPLVRRTPAANKRRENHIMK